MFLVMGILAALLEAGRSGQGQVVDAAMVDGTSVLTTMFTAMAAMGVWDLTRRGANPLDTAAPWYDVYECADGKWLSVGAIEPQFYAELVRLSGFREGQDDSRFVQGPPCGLGRREGGVGGALADPAARRVGGAAAGLGRVRAAGARLGRERSRTRTWRAAADAGRGRRHPAAGPCAPAVPDPADHRRAAARCRASTPTEVLGGLGLDVEALLAAGAVRQA